MNKTLIIFLFIISTKTFVGQATRVAILDFDNISGIAKYDGLGKAMSSMLISDIESNVSPKRLQLVERAQIKKILKEQNFQASKNVNKNTAVQAGKILGVNYLLVGDVYILNDQLIINARLTNTETGDIIFSKTQEGKINDWLNLKKNIAKELATSLALPFTEPAIPDKEINLATITTFGNALEAKDEGEIEKVEELVETIKLSNSNFKYLNELDLWLKNYDEERKKYEIKKLNQIMSSLSPESTSFIEDVMYLLEKLNYSERKSKTAIAIIEKIQNLKYDFNKKVYDGTFENYLLAQKVIFYINLMKFPEAIKNGRICLSKYPNTSITRNVANNLKEISIYQKKIKDGEGSFHYNSRDVIYNNFLTKLSEFYQKNSRSYYNEFNNEYEHHKGDEYFLINVMDSIEYEKIRNDFWDLNMLPRRNDGFPKIHNTNSITISFFNLACIYFDIQSANDILDYFKSNYNTSDSITLSENTSYNYNYCFIGESAPTLNNSRIFYTFDQSSGFNNYSIATTDLLLYLEKKIRFIKTVKNKQEFLMEYKSNPEFDYINYKVNYKKLTDIPKEYGCYNGVSINDSRDCLQSIYLRMLLDKAELARNSFQYKEEISIRTNIINNYKIPKCNEIYQLILIIEANIFLGDFENAEKTKNKLDNKYPDNDWIGYTRNYSVGMSHGYIQK